MLGAITKIGFDGIHAGFRVTIESFGDGVVWGQPLVTDGVVVSDGQSDQSMAAMLRAPLFRLSGQRDVEDVGLVAAHIIEVSGYDARFGRQSPAAFFRCRGMPSGRMRVPRAMGRPDTLPGVAAG